MNKKPYMNKALAWIKKKAYASLKAKKDGYADPKVFTNARTQATVQPDFAARTRNGSKHFMDIALKSDRPQKLVTRWKLLSTMAALKKGKLHLLAPRGHKYFTEELVKKYNIQALVHTI